MKIPFDIKYRPQIESGEYKVELRDGTPVKIIYWEAKGPAPIIGLFMADDGSETTTEAHPNGRWSDDESYESDYDFFIVTPEEELTEFEDGLRQVCEEAVTEAAVFPDRTSEDFAKTHSAELLALAREQFIKDGYVIMKKAFLDAVEKVDPEVMKEVSEDVDMKEALRLEYEKGRAEALKDLPRWRKCDFQMGSENPFPKYLVKMGGAHYSLTSKILKCDEYIPLLELSKLPKEDEK